MAGDLADDFCAGEAVSCIDSSLVAWLVDGWFRLVWFGSFGGLYLHFFMFLVLLAWHVVHGLDMTDRYDWMTWTWLGCMPYDRR